MLFFSQISADGYPTCVEFTCIYFNILKVISFMLQNSFI